jgi:hypothetical protein
VDVVEDQDDVLVELLVEGLSKGVSERIGGPGCERLCEQLQVQRVAESLRERWRRDVGPVGPVPGPAPLDRDRRGQGGLAEAGTCDDQRQAALLRLLE